MICPEYSRPASSALAASDPGSSAVPIAAGESEFNRFDFRDLAELRAADIFQPDLAICGGISEAMRIGAIASAWNLRLAPHLWTGALAFAAGRVERLLNIGVLRGGNQAQVPLDKGQIRQTRDGPIDRKPGGFFNGPPDHGRMAFSVHPA